jgi:hypothetical protein
MTKQTPQHLFYLKVERRGDCLEWTGYRNPKGYGKFKLNGKVRTATHVVWEWAHGPLPEGRELDHRCHNHACVRLRHLRPVTHKENMENFRGATKRSKSGVRGVHQAGKSWIAQVTHRRVNYYLGVFPTPELADAAATAKRLELFTHNDADRRAA